jgi:hypothetical protein
MRSVKQSIVNFRDQSRAGVSARWSRTALLLCGRDCSSRNAKIGQLLEFFGIPWRTVSIDEMNAESVTFEAGECCVLGYAPDVAGALGSVAGFGGGLPRWMKEAHSVYVFGFDETDDCKNLLRYLTGDPRATIRSLDRPNAYASFSAHLREMCGPMSGMGVPVELHDGDVVFDVPPSSEGFHNIITTTGGQSFVRVICQGVRFYLNASSNVIDIDLPSEKHFDVKEHFCSAVPITMYLKWAFRDVCWNNPQTNACLIIDDPLLKPRYGFLNFSELSELMDERSFTTAVAFIPWNWRRTNRHTVTLLRRRSDRFSVAVHGCDHTGSEFATRSAPLLDSKIRTAKQRMDSLVQRTSLHYDRIMVFPQGVFSPETGRALKLNGFIAAVNTEVAPWHNDGNDTKIRDLWDIAIMKYGTFPIFTRRYPIAGIENFAFDAILGKPCLIAAHHDVFKGHGRDLADFVNRLNSLNWNLCWRPLGEVLNRSFRVLTESDETIVIRMFSESLSVENLRVDSREAVFIKDENDPHCVEAVTCNQNPVDFNCDGGYLTFRIRLMPKETAQVRVIYFGDQTVGAHRKHATIRYMVRTRLRRYLSEFRDNYVSQSDFLHKNATWIRARLRG